jgi:hypothetical protein
MAQTVELELTHTELNYLLNLVEDNIRDGSYWGNEKQFRKMQSNVLEKITETSDELILRKVRSSL